ncbi:hypothetical protein ACX8XP_10585 [Calditrichota bacterium LG25]
MKVGKFKFKNEVHYFNYIMQRYFRKTPPIPTHIYLQFDKPEDEVILSKKLIAANCHFPAILNVLAHDKHEEVRNIVYQSTYWQLVGKYQDVLGFGKRERKAFARNESKHNIFILLMFEDDPEVFDEVLNNPAISLTMLVRYIQLLQKRGRGRRDEHFLRLARQALNRKKDQILKLSLLQRLVRHPTAPKNVEAILPFLYKEESLLKRTVFNTLRRVDQEVLKRVIFAAMNASYFENALQQFKAISFLLEILQRRRQTGNLRYSNDPSIFLPHNEYLWKLLMRKRLNIVKNCAEDLANFSNILILTYCHIDKDSEIRALANKTLSVEDILEIARDITTPRKIFVEIIRILDNHFDENIVNKVQELRLLETKRLKEALHEMEKTVQAYIDIIFQSLGYDKINDFRGVINSLEFVNKQINKYEERLEQTVNSELNALRDVTSSIKGVFQGWIDAIYYETSARTLTELEYVKDSIEEILNLKDLHHLTLRPGTSEDVENNIRQKAHKIWQSALSIYLGRIKDLSEMLQRKTLKLARMYDRNQNFIKDFKEALLELETEYKKQIACALTLPCRRCNRRGCAAERFLKESHFLIEQLIDNFGEYFNGQSDLESILQSSPDKLLSQHNN